MQVRDLETKDVPWVERLADRLSCKLYPELIPDWDKRRALLMSARRETGWYAKVVGPLGEPTAVLIAKTGENVWASRRHSGILLWHSTTRGDGCRLLNSYRRWVVDQKSIVFAGWVDDYGIDTLTRNSFLKNGFVQRGGMYVFIPKRF